MLGISKKAGASDADFGLSLDKRDPAQSPESLLMLKVKKLLSLSSSSNEFEAREAMKKANHMLWKHNLSVEDSLENNGDQFSYRIIGVPKSRRSLEENLICNILSDFFFVERR